MTSQCWGEHASALQTTVWEPLYCIILQGHGESSPWAIHLTMSPSDLRGVGKPMNGMVSHCYYTLKRLNLYGQEMKVYVWRGSSCCI